MHARRTHRLLQPATCNPLETCLLAAATPFRPFHRPFSSLTIASLPLIDSYCLPRLVCATSGYGVQAYLDLAIDRLATHDFEAALGDLQNAQLVLQAQGQAMTTGVAEGTVAEGTAAGMAAGTAAEGRVWCAGGEG